jgi:hypothetical protein
MRMEHRCSIRYKYRTPFRSSALHIVLSTTINISEIKIRRIEEPNGNYDDDELQQPRIRLQRHLYAGLRNSWVCSSKLKKALSGPTLVKRVSGALIQAVAGKVIMVGIVRLLKPAFHCAFRSPSRACVDPIPPAAVACSSQPRGPEYPLINLYNVC